MLQTDKRIYIKIKKQDKGDENVEGEELANDMDILLSRWNWGIGEHRNDSLLVYSFDCLLNQKRIRKETIQLICITYD